MASPFHVFRKNQKAMIATLGLLAILAFVFLTPIAMYYGRSGAGGAGGENPVVVKTTKYGDLTARDISIMQQQKRKLLGFFLDLINVSSKDDYVTMMQRQNTIRQFLGDASEESVVNTWLLSQRAKELGMSVNDSVVADIIRSMAGDNVGPEVIQDIRTRQELPEDVLFGLLQEELMAENLKNSFLISLLPMTPGQRWDYFQRLNRTVSAQVAPVEVARFVEEVPEPTEQELKKFFDEHKNNITYPGSPEPGFRVPQMADVEYLKADYSQFADLNSVTDEEIEKYYQENRDTQFRKIDLPGLPEGMDFESSSLLRGLQDQLGTPAQTPAAETPATETPAAETPAAETPVTETPAAEAPAAITPAVEAPAAETPAVEAPAAEVPATEETPATEAPAAETPDSSSVTRSVFRLVSMQEENQGDQPASEPVAQPASEPVAQPAAEEPATDAPESAEVKESAPGEQPADVEKTADAEKAADTSTPAVNPSALGAGLSELDPITNEPPTISVTPYKSLEEVKDDIRQTLALRQARERMQKVLNQAKAKIRKHHELVAISESEEKAPVLDLKKLAEESNLTHGKTGLKSAVDLYDTEIGKSIVEGIYQPVAAMIVEGTHDNQQGIAYDDDQNYYLFWRVEGTEEKTPELTDKGVREQVVQAWKQVQARALAVKEAERLVKEAKKSGQSLRNSIGKSEGVQVKSTGPFSWVQYGNLAPSTGQRTLQMGQPASVEKPGEEFMEAIYSLQPDGVNVAMNYPKTIAYVIQLTDTTPSNDVLWSIFKSEHFENYAGIAGSDLRQVSDDWLEKLKEDAGLDWVRPPLRPQSQQ